MGQNKDSLTGREKAMHASKQNKQTTASHGQAGVQLSPGQQGPITRNDDLGRQTASTLLPSFYFPQFYMLSHMSYMTPYGLVWSYTWVTTTPCSSIGLGQSGWKVAQQKRTWGCWSTAAGQKSHLHPGPLSEIVWPAGQGK